MLDSAKMPKRFAPRDTENLNLQGKRCELGSACLDQKQGVHETLSGGTVRCRKNTRSKIMTWSTSHGMEM